MDSRTEEVKMSRDCRLVIRRVLLGGVGCERGGRSEKSRDMLKDRRFEGDDEAGGVEMSMAMVVECGVAPLPPFVPQKPLIHYYYYIIF